MPEPLDDPRDVRFMDLFEAALQLPATSRCDWLLHECADDPQLASEVFSSVAREERMAGFLTQPLVPRLESDPELTPGQELGDRIRIVRRIAEGGMATVYEALDTKIGSVAVKVPKALFRDRLIAEARHSLRVTHPNICRVYHVDSAQVEDRKVDYLTMELLSGETLQSRISREGPLPVEDLRSLTEQLARGLDEAHQRGIVHADLKGNNVILTQSSTGALRAVITDFGISRQHEPGCALVVSTLRGAPEFVAPELWQGAAASPASDLYAFGVLLYEAGTGVRPDARQDSKSVSPRKLRPELDEQWSAFVCRCLEHAPERRPASTLAVVTDRPQTNFRFWGVAALGLLLAGGAGGYRVLSDTSEAKRVRLAIIPPDTDSASASWGAGMLRQVSDVAARFRSDAGPVIVVPWAQTQTAESDVRTAGATHLVKVRFRTASGRITASGILHHVPTGRDVRTFGGNYDRTSMASIPQGILGAISAALALTGPENPVRISGAAWPEYARGVGYLQALSPALDEALQAFQAASNLDPASALPWARTAEAHLMRYLTFPRNELLRSAEAALREAELRDPDDLDVHLVAGLYYTHASLPERAVVELTRVLQKEPGNVNAVRRLAKAYADMNLPQEALKTWDTAIRMLPGDYRTHLDIGTFFYRRSQYPEAINHWTEVTRLAPRLNRGFHNLGVALNDMGRYAEAEQALQTALKLEENPNTLVGLGSILTYQGRIAESVPYFEKAAQAGSPNHITLCDLGDVYRLTARTVEARSAYRKALERADAVLMQQPRDAYVRSYVAYISARIGDRARAEREAEQALRFGPDTAKVVLMSALTFGALGQVDRAMELVESTPSLKRELVRHPDAGMFAGRLRY